MINCTFRAIPFVVDRDVLRVQLLVIEGFTLILGAHIFLPVFSFTLALSLVLFVYIASTEV